MTWRRIGSSASARGIRLKKCGVIASASLSPESKTPARSSSVSSRCSSSCARVVTRFFSCHFQSFQISGETLGQYPGACERNAFSCALSSVRFTIFDYVDGKVKTLKECVNAGTFSCVRHRLVIATRCEKRRKIQPKPQAVCRDAFLFRRPSRSSDRGSNQPTKQPTTVVNQKLRRRRIPPRPGQNR